MSFSVGQMTCWESLLATDDSGAAGAQDRANSDDDSFIAQWIGGSLIVAEI